jgi:hypothetical protein
MRTQCKNFTDTVRVDEQASERRAGALPPWAGISRRGLIRGYFEHSYVHKHIVTGLHRQRFVECDQFWSILLRSFMDEQASERRASAQPLALAHAPCVSLTARSRASSPSPPQ